MNHDLLDVRSFGFIARHGAIGARKRSVETWRESWTSFGFLCNTSTIRRASCTSRLRLWRSERYFKCGQLVSAGETGLHNSNCFPESRSGLVSLTERRCACNGSKHSKTNIMLVFLPITQLKNISMGHGTNFSGFLAEKGDFLCKDDPNLALSKCAAFYGLIPICAFEPQHGSRVSLQEDFEG